MIFSNRQNKPYNTEDGVLWASRSVAVAGVIFVQMTNTNEIYVLLTKRSMSMPDEAGKWCLPCGYLDWDETVAEATNREIYEETGFNVESYDEILTTNAPMFKIDDNPTSNVLQNITFSSLKFYGNLTEFPSIWSESEESDENRWIPVNTLDSYTLAFNHIDTIQKALKYI